MTHPEPQGGFPPPSTKKMLPFNPLKVKQGPEQWRETGLKVKVRILNIEAEARRMHEIEFHLS